MVQSSPLGLRKQDLGTFHTRTHRTCVHSLLPLLPAPGRLVPDTLPQNSTLRSWLLGQRQLRRLTPAGLVLGPSAWGRGVLRGLCRYAGAPGRGQGSGWPCRSHLTNVSRGHSCS